MKHFKLGIVSEGDTGRGIRSNSAIICFRTHVFYFKLQQANALWIGIRVHIWYTVDCCLLSPAFLFCVGQFSVNALTHLDFLNSLIQGSNAINFKNILLFLFKIFCLYSLFLNVTTNHKFYCMQNSYSI